MPTSGEELTQNNHSLTDDGEVMEKEEPRATQVWDFSKQQSHLLKWGCGRSQFMVQASIVFYVTYSPDIDLEL
jgi:hypothetical protein